MKPARSILLLSLLLLFIFNAAAQQKGYYRFPAINNNTVVFTAEGDLWSMDITTRIPLRITTNLGLESHPSISPDGNWLAFVGQYDGPSEVYVMPLKGGAPRRLTFEEGSPIVYQWTPDGKILYSTTAFSTIPNAQLLKLNPSDGKSEIVPLSQADQGTYSPEGELFFTRLRFQGSHTKRYKGGTAQSLWKFDGKSEAVPLTGDYPGTSKNPLFYNNRIYFLSDRDGVMNIWSMDKNGSGLKQHTYEKRLDLDDADISGDKIVCRQGADIMLYEIATGKLEKLDVAIISDFEQRHTRWINDPKSKISSVDLSHNGESVILTARGRVFSAPVDGYRWSEVTRKYGIRYKDATSSGADNEIVMLSDESGEFEIWKSDQYGFKGPVQVTKGSKNLIESFSPSPDGNFIVFSEKDNRLALYSKSTGKVVTIAQNNFGFSGPFAWSPDSRLIAYGDVAENQMRYLRIYDTRDGKSYQVTSDRFDSYDPIFSRDGKWLYFISPRTFRTVVASPWGSRQPEPYYDKTEMIYAVALDKSAKFPFSEANELNRITVDSVKPVSAAVAPVAKGKPRTEVAEAPVSLIGVGAELYEVPVKAANIGTFRIGKGWIYWSERSTSDRTSNLFALKMTNARNNEAVSIASSISSFTISGDGSKILIRDRNGIVVTKADGTKPDIKKNSVDMKKWVFTVDPVEDWKQMFNDAWRMERDYFYDRNMHGVDWQSVYDVYSPLVERVTDRYELNDLLAQMISELSALHMFVRGGDLRVSSDTVANGYLGAILTRSEEKGGFVIDHIFRSDPDFPSQLAPLARPGSNISEGDIITEVNGVRALDVTNIGQLLANKADMQVRLKVRTKDGKMIDEIVKPISASAFSNLRYSEWEYTRRLNVEKVSDNRIGYLHLRAMGGSDYDDFVENFYPAIGKEGLILDMRHNRGGNIDSWVLEKLMRKAWFYWAPRLGSATPSMQFAFTGHMVVLVDQNTASDGEAFAEGFRRLGLGKVIGVRTWGGEVWLSQSNLLVDNGVATAAETGVYSPDGEWLIEGWGVEPDIVVDNLPFETFNGRDTQLEKAIEHLRMLMKEQPVTKPPVPQYPVKAFDYKK